MSFILTVNSRGSIWLLADRRLSFAGKPPRDDARKVMFLETKDGVAILGYAGLGMTARGTEPSDWMSSVLRGRNLSIEQSLSILADAAKRQLPKHLQSVPRGCEPIHTVMATAFVNDETRLYTISVALDNDKSVLSRYIRHVRDVPHLPRKRTPSFGVTGSGAAYACTNMNWKRPLLHLVKAYETGRIQAAAVAGYLSQLNLEVSRNTLGGTVGPSCVVAWRNAKTSIYRGGGGHQFYKSTALDYTGPSLPIIGNGFDIAALLHMLTPRFMQIDTAMRSGMKIPEIDRDEMNAELALIPEEPDEILR